MRREQSQQNTGARRESPHTKIVAAPLFLVSVPIGHPDDMTIRALAILSHVDIVATEDPLATQSLLRHHNLSPTLTSYGPTKIREKVAVLMHRLQQGASVALVSDCGSPVISDPGCLLVAAAHRNHIPVHSIPGPSAVTAAIAASGFPAEAFHFYGTITTKDSLHKRRLACILMQTETTVVFCQPQSCAAILKTVAAIAPRRKIALTCNLTLHDETIFRGTAGHISKQFSRVAQPQAVAMVIGRATAKTGRKRNPGLL